MKVLYVSKFISINKFLCIINIDLHCQQSFVDCLLIIAPIFLLALDIFSYLMIYTAAIFPIATTHSQQQQEKTHQFFNFPLKSIDRDTRFFSANYLQHVAKSFPQNLLLLVVDRQTDTLHLLPPTSIYVVFGSVRPKA